MNFWWFMAVAMGPLLLGGIIAYALLSRRRLTAREQIRRDEKTDKLYRSESDV